ncbi:MAG: hypothetical protein ACR2O4_11215, partial [Hyphomicrobiaceae bacterium]
METHPTNTIGSNWSQMVRFGLELHDVLSNTRFQTDDGTRSGPTKKYANVLSIRLTDAGFANYASRIGGFNRENN